MLQRLAFVIALCGSGCTFLFPTGAAVMASRNADISVDDRGCERGSGATCVHPGEVRWGTTILENALVGAAVDLFVLAAVMETENDF